MAISRSNKVGKKDQMNKEIQDQNKDQKVLKIIILHYIMQVKTCFNHQLIY
jgi:hypothetical protein